MSLSCNVFYSINFLEKRIKLYIKIGFNILLAWPTYVRGESYNFLEDMSRQKMFI